MTPQLIEEIFGKESAKVYLYTGTLPENENPCVHITIKFVEAINNNLINCIVSPISNRWFVYTKEHHELGGEEFQLITELPLPTVGADTGETNVS